MGHARWLGMNMLPVFASVAKYMMFLVMLHMMCVSAL